MVGRSRRAILVTLVAIMFAASGCAAGDAPPPAGVRPDGFPTGVFEKTFEDPDLGPMRLSWVFDADGDWAEIPAATTGQTIEAVPVRGRYTVDGDLLSITVDWPPVFSDHQHTWKLDGDHLITAFQGSNDPADADLFAILDRQPWVRVP